jgi:hypothetical protein
VVGDAPSGGECCVSMPRDIPEAPRWSGVKRSQRSSAEHIVAFSATRRPGIRMLAETGTNRGQIGAQRKTAAMLTDP